LISLAICIVTGYFWWGDITHSHSISIDTLTKSFENTRQSHKGLEAFVLSGLDEEFIKSLDDYPVTRNFVDAFNQLQDQVQTPTPSGETKGSLKNAATPTPTPTYDLTGSLRVQTSESEETLQGKQPARTEKSITEKFITNVKGDGFLFVPGMLLGISNASNPNMLDAVNKEDSQLKDDIVVSQKIAGNLKSLLKTTVIAVSEEEKQQLVITTEPVQSYFMTASGVIHLDKAESEDDHAHYLRYFKPTTFFPDRPYFWKTFRDNAKIGPIQGGGSFTVGGIFKRTTPYIDLGGNGIVVTLSRGILRKGVESGLFLDFSLGDKTKTQIKQKIKKLGGTVIETSWKVVHSDEKNQQPPQVEPLGTDSLSEQQRALLKTHIQKNNTEYSVIFGNLYVLSGAKTGSAADDAAKRGKVAFTIPVGQSSTKGEIPQSGQTSGTLLYCELDLNKFQWRVSIKAGLIAFSGAAFVFFVFWLVKDYVRRLQEQEKAFHSVGRVMSQAPVAYCRLNEQDQFIEMNKAFAELLGYEMLAQAEEGLINKQTFKGLLADEKSRKEYNRIQALRTNKKETGPYSVKLRGAKGIIEVQVHGANVPMPKSHRKANPQTFGILLEEGVEVISGRSMIITPYFGPPSDSLETTELFVLMQFTPELKAVYKNHIIDVAKKLGLSVSRADDLSTTRAIMSDVWASICAARAIIADCTGLNPNVFYEIGIAHAIGKPVILITQSIAELPFDLSHIRFIAYEYTPDGMKQFERKLEKTLKIELGLTDK
jgi:PAS domain S-box-containing protein